MFSLNKQLKPICIILIAAAFFCNTLHAYVTNNFASLHAVYIKKAIHATNGIKIESMDMVYREELDKSFIRNKYDKTYIYYLKVISVDKDEYEALVCVSYRLMHKLKVDIIESPRKVDKNKFFTQSTLALVADKQNSAFNSVITIHYGVINDDRITSINMLLNGGIAINMDFEKCVVIERTDGGYVYDRTQSYGITKDVLPKRLLKGKKAPITHVILSDTTTVYAFIDSNSKAYICVISRDDSFIEEINAYTDDGGGGVRILS